MAAPSEYAVISNEIVAWSGYERCKLAKKIQKHFQRYHVNYFGLIIEPSSSSLTATISMQFEKIVTGQQ